MCLPIVARVLCIEGEQAEIELRGDGGVARVSVALCSEAQPGSYVLVDRGIVLKVIEEAEAELLLAFYDELAAAMDEFAAIAEIEGTHA